jgi:hypothetical protein
MDDRYDTYLLWISRLSTGFLNNLLYDTYWFGNRAYSGGGEGFITRNRSF